MLAIRLQPDVEKRLDRLAKKTGRTISLILARGSNAVMRAHQMRKVDYRKGKRSDATTE